MGYHDKKWDNLPKKLPFDSLIIAIAVIIHLAFPIPIYFYKKREQTKDQEQQHQFNHDQRCMDPYNVYFKDFVLNYFIIFLLFTGYIVVTILNE